jgi:hypothetical protein
MAQMLTSPSEPLLDMHYANLAFNLSPFITK